MYERTTDRATQGESFLWLTEVAQSWWPVCIRWEYPSVTSGGYGKLQRDRRTLTAHTVVCTLAHGPCPPGLICCHSCHHPWCVNPRHLRWDTYESNMQDRNGNGTDGRGENNPNVKLTALDVAVIRERFAAGEQRAVLAREYGVSWTHVERMVTGGAWH